MVSKRRKSRLAAATYKKKKKNADGGPPKTETVKGKNSPLFGPVFAKGFLFLCAELIVLQNGSVYRRQNNGWLSAELYYVRNGVVNEYALNFEVPVPAFMRELHFTWQSLAGRTPETKSDPSIPKSSALSYMRRNMFQKNKTQEMTENEASSGTCSCLNKKGLKFDFNYLGVRDGAPQGLSGNEPSLFEAGAGITHPFRYHCSDDGISASFETPFNPS
ncbi:hypothetical protein AAG570_002240 [Ranatra chinensis]|uniref:WIF domain-containing protein n=1 Tax=Ranatra chinensis TaxID=642074 RepID=A0ABD0Y6Z2_9HEMI